MCPTDNIKIFIECIVDYFKIGLYPLITGLALFVFLWGVLKFIKNSADKDKRSEGKKLMIWGIFGLFFMICIWAFVEIMSSTFTGNPDIFIPQVKI